MNEQRPLEIRRVINAPRDRVFAAWTTREALERWYTPDADAAVAVHEIDFRVGGRSVVEFGEGDGAPYIETAIYERIDTPSRLVFSTELRRDEALITATQCTVDFLDLGDGRTEVVMTETGYDPANRVEREAGWGQTLDHLVAFAQGSMPLV